MAKRIALFNHKGGVSKTTTTFNLGWMLADRGKTLVMVDADAQCNLTGMVLGYGGRTELDEFYERESGRNVLAHWMLRAFCSSKRKTNVKWNAIGRHESLEYAFKGKMVDVGGFEPPTPCLQSRGKPHILCLTDIIKPLQTLLLSVDSPLRFYCRD